MESLLAKYFAGEATEEEQKKLKSWRNASADNARAFFEAKKIWLASKPEENVRPAIPRKVPGAEKRTTWPGLPVWFRYAAAVVLLMAAWGLYKLMLPGDHPRAVIAEKLTTHELPDGSVVTLQAGSRIDVGDFRKTREVNLEGKAYFVVERDEDKPFVVSTKSATVEVLGTSFVIDAREGDGAITRVLVETGTVTFSQNPEVFAGSSISQQIRKGEMAEMTVGRKGIRKRKNYDDNYLAWKTRNMVFRRTYMKEVAHVLEDVYGIDVIFENEQIARCKLTARYHDKPLQEVMDLISRTFGFKAVQSGDTVTFSGDGCS